MTALRDQANEIKKSAEERAEALWKSFEARMKELNILPEGIDMDQHQVIITSYDQIIIEPKDGEDSNPMHKITEMLRGAGAVEVAH